MLWPIATGEFEPWSNLEPTLSPFLAKQVGGLFMPWTQANAEAMTAGKEEFSVELAGQTWTQKPQKYHVKSLAALRAKYATTSDSQLNALLEKTGCLAGLSE